MKYTLTGMISIALLAGTISCKPLSPTTLQTIEQVVAADLAAGKTPEQIDSDVCAALGGSATTDAVCADATRVIIDIIDALLVTKGLPPVAATNAQAYKAARAKP